MPVTAGELWNISKPDKPQCDFDPNARLRIRMGIQDILDKMGTTYGNHIFLDSPVMEAADTGVHNAGVVVPLIQVKSGAVYQLGAKYAFTIRIIGADGQQDDRTMYFRLKEL